MELMYLLSARSFLYMSPIHYETTKMTLKKYNIEFNKFVTKKVNTLYEKCQEKFNFYSELLSKKEGEIL